MEAKLSPTSVYSGRCTPSCVEQGRTPYDLAKKEGHQKVMGVLDPVSWRWVEHPLVDFGTRRLKRNWSRNEGRSWVVAILMLFVS